MPPHRPKPPRPPDEPWRVPASSIDDAIDSDVLADILAPFVPGAADREFVTRCIAEGGPVHHRGASFALLRLLALALQAAGGPLPPRPDAAQIPVPMRLPPHLGPRGEGEHEFPLALPLAPLERLAPSGSRELRALTECLIDGPAHHALANAAMVSLIGALLDRLAPGAEGT